MQEQNKLLASIQGFKSARLHDNIALHRQAGWRDWAEKNWSKEGILYEKQEFAGILALFSPLFENPLSHRSVSKEIRMMLTQSNLLDTTSTYTNILDTTNTTASKRRKLDPVITPIKNTPTSTTTPTICDANDPWRWESLKAMDLKELSVYEMSLNCREESSTVPSLLLESINRMSAQKLASAKCLVRKAREDLLKHQLVHPQAGELLVHFLERVRLFNDGNTISSLKTLNYKESDRRQFELRDGAAHVLRHVYYNYNLRISRLPGLINSIAPFFLGRSLQLDEFPSETTMRTRFTRLHEIDLVRARKDFEKTTLVHDVYGNPVLWYSCDDDSTHLGGKRHVLFHTYRDADGNPACRLVTTSSAVSADSEGNSTLNVEKLQSLLGTNAFKHYGGATTDNAYDAIATTRLTFSKAMGLLSADDRTINQVVRQPNVWGDPFHIANLVVMHLSLGSFGQTKRDNHQQVHHRQGIQSLYDGQKNNKDIGKISAADITKTNKLAAIPNVKAVRERQQRWMVNQRSSQHLLDLWSIKCGETSNFLLEYCQLMATRLGGYQSKAFEHAGKLFAMPQIRLALCFEAEVGEQYFEPVMAWHSRSGLFSRRAGFRMLEVHGLFFRFEMPFWTKALVSPEEVFKKTFNMLGEIEDENIRATKQQQIVAGVQAAFDELMKMSKEYYSPSNIFLCLLQGREGPALCRAFVRLWMERNTDLRLLIEDVVLPTEETHLEKEFRTLLLLDWENMVHMFCQHGLAKKAAFAEIKQLALTESSSRGIIKFKETFPAIFTTLHSVFGLMMSASRLAEQIHGMLRAHLTNLSVSHETTDQRQTYLTGMEYENRVQRRQSVLSRLDERPKGSIKHEKSKQEQRMVGEQVLSTMAEYSEENLAKTLTMEELKKLKIGKLNAEGVRRQDNERAIKKSELADQKAARRTNVKTAIDFIEEAKNETVDNDEEFEDFEQQQLNFRLQEISTQAFWKEQNLDDLKRVYKSVFPGINVPPKETKGGIITVITAYLKMEKASNQINLQAAIGLERKLETGAMKKKDAILSFARNAGNKEVDTHYYEFI